MADNLMAHPELRHPFEKTPIHPRGSTTVLYQGKTITLSETGEGDNLLVHPADLPRINGFQLKPEGLCYADLCIPAADGLLVSGSNGDWVDVSALAVLLGQPFVVDREAGVWSFAEIPAKRENTLVNAMAPDFEVTDRRGNVIRRADLKGKKALIVTWSSW